ncbi:hypothetical protein D6D13_02759 [Aureobasidium pullulans]|uniref:TEA domain-containing protein n=1 Tax=Aureobasidium pullulans TaxID=5580 RepID=A0A4S9D3M7_AURPU|nr:hypothetical protein D6D13_02759 [Aureobasidium pullulans]
MESFHPTPVVPSNAPLWAEIDQDPRILREQCANRQLGYLQTQNTQDYYSTINDDSTCGSAGARTSAYQPLQFGQGRPGKSHYPWMAGLAQKYDPNSQHLFNNVNRGRFCGLGNIPTGNQEKDQDAERKARLLASRFLRCDGYIKYRNRQPKEKKGSKEDAKWPDHIEDAFIIALCRHPPCGRKKSKAPGEEHNDDAKAMGRNELIADYIFRNTGDVRTRKQVSSHIQVLKPFVQNEAIIMRFLATPGEKESAATKAARKRASVYNPGTQMRNNLLNQHRNYALLTAFDLQPEEFCMFMRPPPPKASETLHTYSTTEGFSPSHYFVQTQAELYDCFPGLANIPPDRFTSGKFLALHAPIVLHPKDLVGETELAIRWVFKAPARNPPVSVSSRTRFYLNGRPIYLDSAGNREFYDNQDRELTKADEDDWHKFTKEYDAAEVSEHNDSLEVDFNGNYTSRVKSDGGMVQYYVPFSSTFWARYLWHVATLQRQTTDLETRPLQRDESNEDRHNQLNKKRLEVSRSLAELTAVQEIIARTEMGEPQVVLTVHFSFSHAMNKEAAVTTWQYLDMTSAFEDAIPLSAGGVSQISQSASDSQESALSVQDAYGGGSHDYATFDFSATNSSHHVNNHHAYPDPSDTGANALASLIDLHDTQATTSYNTSWLLPTSATDLDHLASTVLDPLLPHGPQSNMQQHNLHDMNNFDFSNGNISISLDSSALSPHQPVPHSSAAFSSAIDALDLDLTATDPLLLEPSRTATPWMQSSNATPTDYAALFSQPHSPATATFPDYGNGHGAELADHLAAAAGGLTDTFDVNSLPNSFSLTAHQAYAGAGNGASDLDHTSRQHSFSAVPEDTEAGGVAVHDSNHFSPTQHQGYGYIKGEFSQHDGFALPQQQESFDSTRQDSFASHADAFASQTDTHDFAHSFDVGADNSFDVNDLHETRPSQSHNHSHHQEAWAGAGF